MKAPVVALKQPGNHGPHAGSICQKICPQRPKPGKYDYFAQPESYSRSGAWEFFTEDELEGRNAVRIITPSGQSFSVSEYKVMVAGVRVESE
jgi:hypothetical protein